VMMLRIEDTDEKRKIDDGIGNILQGLRYFGIQLDEGPLGEVGENGIPADVGAYGPYVQSQRRHLYRAFVKQLVAEGKAYPCWMSEQEIEETRNMQQASKKIPGIYGEYAKRRYAELSAQEEKHTSGAPYVIRLRAANVLGDKITVYDEIKGESTTQANFIDHVLLKANDGLPTYHMAHLVDDYLMGTTHVIRADEWFASLPLHVQLFAAMGVAAPKYAHVAPFLIVDAETGNKRKLSKRKDKEADVRWFAQQGISAHALLTYIMNVIDPSFEEWAAKHPDKDYLDFQFTLGHMNQSGALFDMQKLFFVSKEELAGLDKETFATHALIWAKGEDHIGADSMLGVLQ
jgi:glutamyl-tRNA synthetase